MSRFVGLACAGVFLLAAAGCEPGAFLAPFPFTSNRQQMVDDKLEQVSARLKEGLSDAGVSVLSKRVGAEMRLAGQTKTGKVFCLHLYAKNVDGANRTLVRVKWDREADEAFWELVCQLVAVPGEAKDGE